MAAVERLPLILVIANNQYAYSTPISRQFACESLARKAPGYGAQSHEVDGTDLAACLETLRRAIDNARGGGGPQIIVAELLRLCGHGEHDDSSYIDPRLRDCPLGRDCLHTAEQEILRQGWADAAQLEAWRAEAAHKVEEAVAQVQREPAADPYSERWCALSVSRLAETGLDGAQA